MSNVALTGPFVWVYFYLLRLFIFCLLNLFIYFVLGYRIRWRNEVVCTGISIVGTWRAYCFVIGHHVYIRFLGQGLRSKLVHCCSWLLTESQCKIISVQQNYYRPATDTQTRVAVSQDKTEDSLWQFF